MLNWAAAGIFADFALSYGEFMRETAASLLAVVAPLRSFSILYNHV